MTASDLEALERVHAEEVQRRQRGMERELFEALREARRSYLRDPGMALPRLASAIVRYHCFVSDASDLGGT